MGEYDRFFCIMCAKEIYYSPDYRQWLHLRNGEHWCPGKSASIATPPANTPPGVPA